MKLQNYRSVGKENGHYWAQMFEPIFRRNLVVLWVVTPKQAERWMKKHGAELQHDASVSSFNAWFERDTTTWPYNIIFLGEGCTQGSAYHEAVHCAQSWMKSTGIPHTDDTEEVMAYMTEAIGDFIMECLDESGVKLPKLHKTLK